MGGGWRGGGGCSPPFTSHGWLEEWAGHLPGLSREIQQFYFFFFNIKTRCPGLDKFLSLIFTFCGSMFNSLDSLISEFFLSTSTEIHFFNSIYWVPSLCRVLGVLGRRQMFLSNVLSVCLRQAAMYFPFITTNLWARFSSYPIVQMA